MDFKTAPMKFWIRCLLIACLAGAGAVNSAPDCAAQSAQDEKRTDGNPQDTGQPDPEQGRYRTVDILHPEPDPSQPQISESNSSEINEPIPIPISPIDANESLGGKTFVDDVFRRAENRWGLALSAYQAYTTNVSGEGQSKNSSGITAFMPRAFFNFGKRKSILHLDVGAGYRRYNHRRASNAWDYSGNAQYSLRISDATSFRVSDQLTSSFNDAWSFLSLYSPLGYDLLSSNEVLFNRLRITRNAARAELSHQISEKAGFGVFGGHRWYDYQRNTLSNSTALEYGGSFSYQIARWLHLSSSVTSYYNLAGSSIPDAQIYHIQIGGLDFRLSNSWRIWGGGGIDISEYERKRRTASHINAGIGYTSKSASFHLTYQRGFTSAIGISRLLLSDVASANYGHRINNWLNANLQSYYYRSSETVSNGWLETLSGGGGLEFALRRDLVLTMNAFYQNQRARRFSVEGLGLSRLTGYLGLQYVWPARKYSDY
jgi:hypothetical protein